MGSDESHFNVSVGSDGQSYKTVSTNLHEEKGEPKRYRTEVLPLTARPNGLNRRRGGGRDCWSLWWTGARGRGRGGGGSGSGRGVVGGGGGGGGGEPGQADFCQSLRIRVAVLSVIHHWFLNYRVLLAAGVIIKCLLALLSACCRS